MANRKYILNCWLQKLKFILVTTKDKDLLNYCEREIRHIKEELNSMIKKKK